MSVEETLQYQDVSELLQTGEPVVLAVDQVPFEVESRGVKNTFCLLVPLMTDGGSELDRTQFRNRERVWWMLRPDILPHQIHVGTVWSGPIERSRAYGNPEREKDHYQVRRSDIRPGARNFVEVLNLNVAHPDLTELLSPEGIPWPYPPLPCVVIRGGLSIVGPFRARYNFDTGRLQLKSLTDDHPHVYRMPQADFLSNTEIREYSYSANQWDAKAQEKQVDLAFLPEQDLIHLTEKGEQLDGATDIQVVHWALDFMKVPEENRDLFRNVLEDAGTLAAKTEHEEFKERMDRFEQLCVNRSRIVELGSEVAKKISQNSGFRDLVGAHIDAITTESVKTAIEERQADIEQETAESTVLRDLLGDLASEFHD
ncbi:MAG: hypothetical protein AAF517_28550, partial [Planctomycetota bacterium]